MRALSIAWKDIRHVYRNVAGLTMMLVAPLLLAFALGAAFGAGDNFSIAAVQDRRGRPGRGRRGGCPRRRRHLAAALGSPEIDGPPDRQPGRHARGGAGLGRQRGRRTWPSSSRRGSRRRSWVTARPRWRSIRTRLSRSGRPSSRRWCSRWCSRWTERGLPPLTSVQLAASLGVTDGDELSALAADTAKAFGAKAEATPPITLEERAPVTPGAEAPEAAQRRQPGPGGDDALLHALRCLHSRPQHPRRAPGGHALPALHHSDAAERDPGRQVHRRLPCGAHPVGRSSCWPGGFSWERTGESWGP